MLNDLDEKEVPFIFFFQWCLWPLYKLLKIKLIQILKLGCEIRLTIVCDLIRIKTYHIESQHES